MKTQKGGLVLGLIIGLLVGLAVALGVALYVTKAPVPFVNKVPPRTADQDAAEAERNRNWDPNAGLLGKARPIEGPASGASAAAPAVPPPAPLPAPLPPTGGARDPAAILSGATPAPAAASAAKAPAALPPVTVAPPAAADTAKTAKGGAEPFVFFVQAGAFQSSDEAEQQRARLAMLGVETRLVEREQSGRTVFRVRAGPFAKQAEADAVKEKLNAANVETMLVRVERQP